MGYIAKTNGGQSVLEVRTGVLADIPEAERGNWRACVEVRPSTNRVTDAPSMVPTLTVNGDGSQVNIVWPAQALPSPWAAMKLKEHVAATRWTKSQLPLVLPNGVEVDGSEASKVKVQQVLDVLSRGWAATVDFKASNGWVALDLAGITAVAQALVAREQALFTTEKQICEGIDTGTITTVADVNAYPWP